MRFMFVTNSGKGGFEMSNAILLLILYIGFAAEYAVNKLLARYLDLDGFGDFNVAVSAAVICSMIFVFGGDAGSNRFIPRYLEGKEWGKIKGYVVYYLRLSLFTSISVAAASLMLDVFLRYYHLDKFLHESYFAMVLAPVLSVLVLFGGLLLAMHREYASSITTELLKFVLFLAAAALWVNFRSSMNACEAIFLLLASLLSSVAIQSVIALKSVPFDFFREKMQMSIPEWISVSRPMLVIGLANNFVSIIELWSLEFFDYDEASVGAFSLLTFISSLIWVNYTALYYIMSSRISTIANDSGSLRKIYVSSVVWLLIINCSVGGALVMNAEAILGWFHADMVAYKNWLGFVLIGAALNSVLQVASPFLRFGGHEKVESAISSRILMAGMLVSPLMVYFFGIGGAIVSSVLMLFVRGLLFSLRLRSLHGFSYY